MVSAERKCLLHIGYHKTGTTSIQDYLWANRAGLIRQGFLYPEQHTLWSGHHQVPWSLGVAHTHYDKKLAFDAILTDYVGELSERGGHTLVLSSEDFEFLSPSGVDRLRSGLEARGFQTRVVAYVRRQDDYLLADYKQHLKMGFAGSLDEFYMTHHFEIRFNYAQIMLAWEKAFSKAALTVIGYEKSSLREGDVCTDFCDTVGITRDGFLVPAASNVSQTNIASHILARANALQIAPEIRKRIIELVDAECRKTGVDVELFPQRKRELLLAKYKSTNETFVRHYEVRNGDYLLGRTTERPAKPFIPGTEAAAITVLVSSLASLLLGAQSDVWSSERTSACGS
jgi:hypothetical protein